MKTRDVVFGTIIAVMVVLEGYHFTQKLGHPDAVHAGSWVAKQQGEELDRRFVDALVSRYRDTMDLAEAERTRGHNPELRKLAAALLQARRTDLDALMRITTADSGRPVGDTR